MEKNDVLTARFIDLALSSEQQHIYTETEFLSPVEQEMFLAIRSEIGSVRHNFLGGPVPEAETADASESADPFIRKIIVFGCEEEMGYPYESPIRVIHIRPVSEKFGEELSHRDYLGAILNLGIDRKYTGDIIVKGKEAWVLVMESMADYLIRNLETVRHTRVLCELAGEDIPALTPKFESINSNIASERMDLVVSAVVGINRNHLDKLFKGERVFRNGRLVTNGGHKITAGDVIVVRGFGKFIYDGPVNTTRKGRLNVVIRKFV